MKKRTRFQSLLALLLLVCMLLSICSVLTACGDDDEDSCKHTNTSVKNVKEATCAQKGYTGDTVCNDCTAIVSQGKEIPTLEHTYDTGKVTKNPTCIDTGITTYTCTVCATIKAEAIPTVAHQDSYHDAQDGNHFHTCLTCTLNDKQEHTPVEGSAKQVAATCTSPAYTEYTCADCNGVYKVYSSTELALGHDLSAWETVESTCLSAGSKTQYCKREGCTESHSIAIPVATSCNMVFSHWESEPNCTNAGIAVYQCPDCLSETTKEVKATGIHNYVTEGDNGDGFITKRCSVCNDVISSFDASSKVTADVKIDKIDKTQALEMNMKEAAIQFPSDVVSAITNGSDLSVSADVLDDTTKTDAVNKVTDAATKEALATAPVYDFTVKVDGATFTDNFSTKVAITLPYDNGDNDADGIVIYYLAENGEIEAIEDVVYNAETKEVSFFVEHFSFYAVAFQETQDMRCKRGNHNYDATSETVTATCYQFGYTLYECTNCHRQTVDDIVERKEHNYGDIIPAKPTCENGAWSTRVCQNAGCHSVIEVTFTGATGHEINNIATCDTASTCNKCNKVLARPLGHSYTEWEVVKAATELETGIRRRHCLTCGATDEETIATLGTVESIKYESYTDLLNIAFADVLGINNGTLQLEAKIDDKELVLDVKIMKTQNGYRMSVVCNMNDYDGDELNPYGSRSVEFYYDNGVFVALNGDSASASEIENLIPITIDVYKEMLEQIFVQLDSYAAEYLALARNIIEEYKGLYGEDINAIFEAAGLDYTVDTIDELVDSVETVYAYLALKLGYTTSLEMKGDVVLPSSEDFKAVLDAIMDSTTTNGITTYTFTEAPIYEVAKDLIAFMKEHADDSLAEFIYFAIGDSVKEYDATLTDFNKVIDFIAKEFPGTFTVSDAIDMYIEFAQENGLPAIEKFYAIIDSAVGAQLGGQSVAQIVEQLGPMSLDQLASQMMGGNVTMADIYAQIKEMAAKTIIGELVIDSNSDMTYNEYVSAFEMIIDAVDFSVDISISIDSEGRLVSLSLGQALSIYEGFSKENELIQIDSVKFSVKRDDSVTVEVPEALKGSMVNVETHYDNAGNLIIEGLKSNVDYEFSVMGSGSIAFADAVIKDEDLSREYGSDIYVLKEQYWHDIDNVGDYVLLGGKYYERNYAGEMCVWNNVKTVTFAEFKASLSDYILNQLENEYNPYGSLVGTETTVYGIYLAEGTDTAAIAYKQGETWMVATTYGYAENYDETSGYYAVDAQTLSEFVNSIRLGATSPYSNFYDKGDNYYAEINGQNYPVLAANVSVGTAGKTVQLRAASVNGVIHIINSYSGTSWKDILSFEDGIDTLPEYDDAHIYTDTVIAIDASGNLKEVKVTHYYLYDKVPTYYVKVTDTIFTRLNSSYLLKAFDTTDMQTLSLPDGNTLYVMGESNDNDYAYKYGYTTVYGYAKTVSGVYVQTAAFVTPEGTVAEVRYRDASTEESINFEDAFIVNTYLNKDASGVYTVSASLISKLKELCTSEGSMYAIAIRGTQNIGGVETNYMYYVGSYANVPEFDLDDVIGGGQSDYEFWRELFGDYGYEGNSYTLVHNDDGSISLVFPVGSQISNISLPSNAEFPSDDLFVKNQELSEQTGLDIYTFNGSYTNTHVDEFVYRNGKYYDFSEYNNYDFVLSDDMNFADSWEIRDSYYRFNTSLSEGGEVIPVYETTLSFNIYNYLHHYGSYDNPTIDVYTFFVDGVMNVAVGAQVTGESLLTFESYMPIKDYMNSLTFEIEDDEKFTSEYYRGSKTMVYSANVRIFEEGSDYSINSFEIRYILKNGAKKLIVAKTYLPNLIKIDSTAVEIDTDKYYDRYEYKRTFSNGTVTVASYSYDETYTYAANFVKLAGRMYRYDGGYWENTARPYQYGKIDESKFNNLALDKVWYYRVDEIVEGDKEYGNVNSTYYTEFIPSDYGFAPAGDVIDPSMITGEYYSETLLGYTADGNPIYEVAYYVSAEGSPKWDVEEQDDGTFFLHKNGAGYLMVIENNGTYYVKARKVEMADGTTQIYCFLRNGRLTGSEIDKYTENALDEYIFAEGNKLTITEEFLEIAKNNNRNEFSIKVEYGNENYSNYEYIDYYMLESLFMAQ